jgi:hypothetical protein
MTRKKPVQGTRFDDLPDDRKEAEYRAIDRPFDLEETQPLDASDRRLFQKAASRRSSRPLVRARSQVISLDIESQLLKEADALAKRRGLSRATIVAEGLRMLVGKAC